MCMISFFNIISKLSSNYHYIRLKSCASPNLGAWISIYLVIPWFKMASNILSSTLNTRLGLPHPTTRGISWCICGQPIDPTRIHLLHCDHGGKCIATHDAVWNYFTSIIRDVGFHVLHQQTHVLPTPSL
jgi:hypothetical protein